jgi:Ca2+-binding EF-hand superfamily protein
MKKTVQHVEESKEELELTFTKYNSRQMKEYGEYYTFLHFNKDEIIKIESFGSTSSNVNSKFETYSVEELISDVAKQLDEKNIEYEVYGAEDENYDELLDEYDLENQEIYLKIKKQ